MTRPEPPEPLEAARRLADAFEASGIPYAIGGALALAFWAVPRATKDVDVNVFLGPADIGRVVAVLRGLGLSFDEDAFRAAAAEGGNAIARDGEVVVDLFLNSIPLHDAAAARVVRRPLLGRPARILSAEDTVLFKLLFFRPKDLVDVALVVSLQRETLDRTYIRDWLVELMGEDDPRVVKWDELSNGLPRAGS